MYTKKYCRKCSQQAVHPTACGKRVFPRTEQQPIQSLFGSALITQRVSELTIEIIYVHALLFFVEHHTVLTVLVENHCSGKDGNLFFCLGISTRCARLQKLIDLFLNKNPSNILNHYCKYKIKSPISVSSQNPSDIFCLLRIPLSVATFPLRHHPAQRLYSSPPDLLPKPQSGLMRR